MVSCNSLTRNQRAFGKKVAEFVWYALSAVSMLLYSISILKVYPSKSVEVLCTTVINQHGCRGQFPFPFRTVSPFSPLLPHGIFNWLDQCVKILTTGLMTIQSVGFGFVWGFFGCVFFWCIPSCFYLACTLALLVPQWLHVITLIKTAIKCHFQVRIFVLTVFSLCKTSAFLGSVAEAPSAAE